MVHNALLQLLAVLLLPPFVRIAVRRIPASQLSNSSGQELDLNPHHIQVDDGVDIVAGLVEARPVHDEELDPGLDVELQLGAAPVEAGQVQGIRRLAEQEGAQERRRGVDGVADLVEPDQAVAEPSRLGDHLELLGVPAPAVQLGQVVLPLPQQRQIPRQSHNLRGQDDGIDGHLNGGQDLGHLHALEVSVADDEERGHQDQLPHVHRGREATVDSPPGAAPGREAAIRSLHPQGVETVEEISKTFLRCW